MSVEIQIELGGPEEALALFGSRDQHLRFIRQHFEIRIVARNGVIKLIGERSAVESAATVVRGMLEHVRSGLDISPQLIKDLIQPMVGGESIEVPSSIEGFSWRSAGQKRYMELIEQNDIRLVVLHDTDGIKPVPCCLDTHAVALQEAFGDSSNRY